MVFITKYLLDPRNHHRKLYKCFKDKLEQALSEVNINIRFQTGRAKSEINHKWMFVGYSVAAGSMVGVKAFHYTLDGPAWATLFCIPAFAVLISGGPTVLGSVVGAGKGIFNALTRKPISILEQKELLSLLMKVKSNDQYLIIKNVIKEYDKSTHWSQSKSSAELFGQLRKENNSTEHKFRHLLNCMILFTADNFAYNNGKALYTIIKNEIVKLAKPTGLLSNNHHILYAACPNKSCNFKSEIKGHAPS